VDNNYLDLDMNKSGFVHYPPSGRHIDTTARAFLFCWVSACHVMEILEHQGSTPCVHSQNNPQSTYVLSRRCIIWRVLRHCWHAHIT
jgi:hypothetical protein